MPRTHILISLLILAATSAAAGAPVMIDNFESGIAAWDAVDSLGGPGQPSAICSIYPVAKPAPGSGRQSALLEFLAGQNAWAIIEREVNGAQWADNDCGQLSLWIKGDGTKQTVLLTLRAFPPGVPNGVDYTQKLSFDGDGWQRFKLRFFGFANPAGNELTPDRIHQVGLLRVKKAGTWDATRFYVDEIAAEAIGENTVKPVPAPAGPPGVIVEVDFGAAAVSSLAQFGVRLNSRAAEIIDKHDVVTERLAKYLRSLAPCVVGVRLGSYYNATKRSYDVSRLLMHLDWLQDHGARWLLTLDPPPGSGNDFRLYSMFRDTCVQVAANRSGASTGHYYEIFENPTAKGLFADINAAGAAYTELAAAIKQADPTRTAQVGGLGFASAWDEGIEGSLGAAGPMDFSSFHFFCGHGEMISDSEAVECAVSGQSLDLTDQLTFVTVRQAAHKVRPALENVFISDLGIRSGGGFSEGSSPRQYMAAAWLATVGLTAAPLCDKLLYHELCGPPGLLDSDAEPAMLYRAVWMLSNWAPRGSRRYPVVRPIPEVVAGGFRTKTASNVIIAYSGEDPCTLRVKAKGISGAYTARSRKLDQSAADIQQSDLTGSPKEVGVGFAGPGMAIVQFIPRLTP